MFNCNASAVVDCLVGYLSVGLAYARRMRCVRRYCSREDKNKRSLGWSACVWDESRISLLSHQSEDGRGSGNLALGTLWKPRVRNESQITIATMTVDRQRRANQTPASAAARSECERSGSRTIIECTVVQCEQPVV